MDLKPHGIQTIQDNAQYHSISNLNLMVQWQSKFGSELVKIKQTTALCMKMKTA